MPLKLTKGDITQFQANTCFELIFEDNSPGAIITSLCIHKSGGLGSTSIKITMPTLTEAMFTDRYPRYQDILNRYSKEFWCYVSQCNQAQYDLFLEFAKENIFLEDSSFTLEQFIPAARQDTEQEKSFKALLETFKALPTEKLKDDDEEISRQFTALLLLAEEICKQKQNTFGWCMGWDALWILGQTCLDKALLQEANEAFLAIPENNWYRRSASLLATSMVLENITFEGMNDAEKHEALRNHLIAFFQETGLDRDCDFVSLALKFIELAGCTLLEDFPGLRQNLGDYTAVLLALANRHYLLQKEDPTFKPKVEDYSKLFETKSNASVSSVSEAVVEEKTSEPMLDTWQVEGDLDAFLIQDNAYKNLKFVNQSKNPRFFTRIDFSNFPLTYSEGEASLTKYQQNVDISLPGMYEEYPSEMNERYKSYRSVFHIGYYSNDKICKLILNVEQLRESPLKEFFGFLQDKIPPSVLEKLQKCIVAKTPTVEEQAFTVELEKLDVEAKNFDVLLELAKAVATQPTSQPHQKDDYLLFVLGKKCLALQLPDQAYAAFSCLEGHYFTEEAHFAISKILLDKMQFFSSETLDANHEKMGEQLVGYFKAAGDFYAQAWDLLVEKLRLYAGLAIGLEKEKKSQLRDMPSVEEEGLGILALMLELAERIYLLKENSKKLKEKDKQPEGTSPGSSPLMILSSRGQQATGGSINTSSSSNAPENNPCLDDDEHAVNHGKKKLG